MMSKNLSLGVFSVLAFVLLGLVWVHTGSLVPPSGSDSIWFHAGLLTLLIGRFILEYRFTKPNDVFANCIIVFASTSTLSSPPLAEWWAVLRWGSLACALVAIILSWDPGQEAKTTNGRLRRIIYQVVTSIGRAEVIFSLVFVLALVSYFDLSSPESKIFAAAWGIFLLASNLNFQGVADLFLAKVQSRKVLGVAHSFLAPSIVFATRLAPQKIQLHQMVGFTQITGGELGCLGMVIGERTSADETRVVVALTHSTVGEAQLNDRSLMVTATTEDCLAAQPPVTEFDMKQYKKVIGTVAKGTNISRVKFELFGSPVIGAGSLLRAESSSSQVHYQVFDGLISEEQTLGGSARSFVEGEAEQVGYWDANKGGFETHDWVARERALVFAVDATDSGPMYELKQTEMCIGTIPKSNYPVNIDLYDFALYHSAILGVTGSGKSFLAYRIIEENAAKGIKTVCIDPTGDYQRYLEGAVILDGSGTLDAFLDSADHFIAIIETASHAMSPILQASNAAQRCLDWCKAHRQTEDVLTPRPKVTIVLEEAHLLVPEWNFNPVPAMQQNVNSTAQIVLQARKYGLGFMVVSQRTANVTKSVLNQCNTIISFQAFDETGFDFLKNYMGAFHVRSLPNLKPRHGIVVGKASKSRRPVMMLLEDQHRSVNAEPAAAMPLPQLPPDDV